MTRRRLLALTAMLLLTASVTLAVPFLTTPHPRGGHDQPAAADIGFLQDMITHHHQAVTMAEIVRDSTDPEIAGLADVLRVNQYHEIGQMTGLLHAWDQPTTPAGHPMQWMTAHGHTHQPAPGQMPGMATREDLDRLGHTTGTAQDILFLHLMIRHHEGGVRMADTATTTASTPQARALAQQITITQTEETHRMTTFLTLRTTTTTTPAN